MIVFNDDPFCQASTAAARGAAASQYSRWWLLCAQFVSKMDTKSQSWIKLLEETALVNLKKN